MITTRHPRGLAWLGWLAIAVTACGGSGPGGGATGGTTSTAGSGGSGPASGSGGVSGSGGTAGPPASGGTGMTGGTGQPSGGQVGGGTGGASGTGGATSTGGTSSGGSGAGSGGAQATGGAPSSAGANGAAGSGVGGRGGSLATGGASGRGGGGGGAPSSSGGSVGSGGRGGGGNAGTCTASRPAGSNPTGSGPHAVTVETNAGAGISEGTIFRPTDLGGATKYPIFVWGEGACAKNGLANTAAMAEIASHGYFVIADGTPNGSGNRAQDRSMLPAMAAPLIAYIDWAIAENDKPCSAYYQSLDATKVGANGFSCGGLMSEGTAGDPRITTWGVNSSGLLSANSAFYKTIHTPVLIVLGGSGDVAYPNGERDYDNIAALGIPVMLFSKALGHGGDLFSTRGGDFTKIDLAWLNWRLKGDEGATGKGVLVGSGCSYCSNSAWEVKSKNIQ